MEPSSEAFFSQFGQLAALSQEFPTDEAAIEKEKVGSLLLTAAPLEFFGANAFFQTAAGKAGLEAVSKIGSRLFGKAGNAIETIKGKFSNLQNTASDLQELGDRNAGNLRDAAGSLREQVSNIQDVFKLPTNEIEMQDVQPVDEELGDNLIQETNIDQAFAARQQPAPEAPDAVESNAAEELQAVDIGPVANDNAIASGADAGADAGVTSAVTDATLASTSIAEIGLADAAAALGPVGAIVGIAATIGIALKDLFDHPSAPTPVYSAYQMGI